MTARVQSYTLKNHGNKKAFKVVCETVDGIKIKRFNPTTTYAIDANPKQAAEDAARAYAAEINKKGSAKFFDETKLSFGIKLFKIRRRQQHESSIPRELSFDEMQIGFTDCDNYLAKTSLYNMKVKDIDDEVLPSLVNELKDMGCTNNKIDHVISTLKKVLDVCVKPPKYNGKKIKSLIDGNKLRGVVWKPGKRKTKPVSMPQKKDMQKIIDEAEGVYKIMFLTISLTGMRWQEAAALRWSRVGWNSRIITIDHAVKRVNKVPTVVPKTKTEAGERTIPIPGQLLAALQKWKDDPKSDKSLEDNFVFGQKGTFIPHATAKDNFNRIKNKLGLKFKGVIHSLRHYYASLLFEWHKEKIISLIEVQDFIGHEDYAFTAKLYAEAFNDNEHRFKQLDKIDQFLQN